MGGSAGAGARSSILGPRSSVIWCVCSVTFAVVAAVNFRTALCRFAWRYSTCHVLLHISGLAPFGALCTHCAHRVWGARPQPRRLGPRTAPPAHTSPSAPRTVSARPTPVSLHLHFFRRAICEASTLLGDRHPSRLHPPPPKRPCSTHAGEMKMCRNDK